jgi:EAL domain-containing protein (putative c-di-GMP-specific phosphodiesterase class I)
MYNWLLEHYCKETRGINRILIDETPFNVGRQTNAPLCINSKDVSRTHASFTVKGNNLILSDLGSANGTFVNHKPIAKSHILTHGDIIHFANVEYRLIREIVADNFSEDETFCGIAELTSRLPTGLNELQELLNNSLVTAVFQEIVTNDGKTVFGYESLGRGKHSKLPVNPGGLFQLAESSGMAVGLSEMMRVIGVELAKSSGTTQPLFVNTHPHELENPDRLLDSLFSLKDRFPAMNLVLEIHEEAVANNLTMERIKKELKDCGIKLAYDDFGSGQARLSNLVETPPDFLKFDIAMIQGIHKAPKAHRRLVESLVQISKDAGITVTAEGIDNPNDAKTCRKIGFDYLQGYYFSPHLIP